MSKTVKSSGICDDGLVSLRDAMKFLSISERALYRMMAAGEIAWTQIGGRRKIPKRALVAISERNLVAGNVG